MLAIALSPESALSSALTHRGWFEGEDLSTSRVNPPTPWTPSHPISIMQLEVEAVWVAGLLTLGELTLLVSDALRYLHATIGLSLIP